MVEELDIFSLMPKDYLDMGSSWRQILNSLLVDDRHETRHRHPCSPDILQFLGFVLLRQRSSLPSQVECRTVYVKVLSLLPISDVCFHKKAGLSGFALFVAIFGILLSSFMLLVPVAYEKYNRLIRLAHAVREVRVSFIMTGTGVTFSLLIAYVFYDAEK